MFFGNSPYFPSWHTGNWLFIFNLYGYIYRLIINTGYMKKVIMLAAVLSPLFVHAQDELVRKLESNKSYNTIKSDDHDKKYHFTTVIDLEHTDVRNQASSGT